MLKYPQVRTSNYQWEKPLYAMQKATEVRKAKNRIIHPCKDGVSRSSMKWHRKHHKVIECRQSTKTQRSLSQGRPRGKGKSIVKDNVKNEMQAWAKIAKGAKD